MNKPHNQASDENRALYNSKEYEEMEERICIDQCPTVVLFNQGKVETTSVSLDVLSQNVVTLEELEQGQLTHVAKIGWAVQGNLDKLGHRDDVRTLIYQRDSWAACISANVLISEKLGFGGDVDQMLQPLAYFEKLPKPAPMTHDKNKTWPWERELLKKILSPMFDMYVVSIVGDLEHTKPILQAYRERVSGFPRSDIPDDIVLAPGEALIISNQESETKCIHVNNY